MKIKELHIENFKSLENVTLKDPNPLTVFAGPNGSGKSNLFEALEFMVALEEAFDIKQFGSKDDFLNFKKRNANISFTLKSMKYKFESNFRFLMDSYHSPDPGAIGKYKDDKLSSKDYKLFFKNFSRIFLNNTNVERLRYKDDKKLNFYGSNLEKVLKRLLNNRDKKEEIIDLLQMFIPEFEKVEIETSNLSGNENILIFEKGTKKPFPKHLISDGTFNIIALIVAVLQYDKPQFLCIEEPENGLHPQVIKELVNFFREQCELKGHYIWLTTHSEALVSELIADEIVMVTKKNGATHLQQFKNRNFYSLTMDEAWKSNVLGGLPW